MILGAVQRTVSYALTAAVVALLVVAWIVTAPFLRWGVAWNQRHRGHLENHPLRPKFGTRTPK